jgi:hypothetical protein
MRRYDAMWLRTPHWLTAPTAEVLRLQRPLPDGSLMVVARGEKSDGFEDEEASPNPADFRLTPVGFTGMELQLGKSLAERFEKRLRFLDFGEHLGVTLHLLKGRPG